MYNPVTTAYTPGGTDVPGADKTPSQSVQVVYHSIYPSIHLSIHPFTHLSIHPFIHLPIYQSIHLSIYPSIHPCINPSLHLPIYLIKVADVDGDGDADIIVANDGAPSVVYFQVGVNTGSYLTATPIGGTPFDATSRTTKVVVADYTES